MIFSSLFLRPSRRGMTMIELVAALAIFTILALTLFSMLDTATSLWSSASEKREETAEIDTFLDLLTADLEQAVADGGNITNPVFFAWTPPARPGEAASHPFLRFVRTALPYTPDTHEKRLSLDCVTYLLTTGCLSRSVTSLPLDQEGETLGRHLQALSQTGIPDGSATSILIRKAHLHGFTLNVPEEIAPPFETNTLPYAIALSLGAYEEEDWNTLLSTWTATGEEAIRARNALGARQSRIIHLPAAGGASLP